MTDNLIESKPANLFDLANYQIGSIVSRQILKKEKGNVTLFALDQDQIISEHTTPFDALVFLLEGEAEITISGQPFTVKAGEILLMPANQPHALKAVRPFKMVLTMIRA